MDSTCKVCKLVFKNFIELHRHLRQHKLSMVEYYYLFYPRKDLLTGNMIEFRNLDFYFHHDFNTKENMASWLEKQEPEKAKSYCLELLKRRRERKRLVYSPTQIELRTVMSPSLIYYNRLFGDYYELCSSLGFKNRYLLPRLGLEEDLDNLRIEKQTILIDTREQVPYSFDVPVKSIKLDYGDYCIEGNMGLVIERKTLKDFIATLSNGYKRFINEIVRAFNNASDLVVLVEQSLNDCLSFQDLTNIDIKWRITPEFVFHNVREIIQIYGNVQFLFVKDRTVAEGLVKKLLLARDLQKKYDLQLLYDQRVLK